MPLDDASSAKSIKPKAIATVVFCNASLLAANAVVFTPVLSTASQRDDYVHTKSPEFLLPPKDGCVLEESD
jgi:hypothetical protein